MEESKLTISVSLSNGWQVIALEGRLDANTAPQAQKEILTHLSSITPKLAVEASKLEYLSSAGVRALLMGAKAAHGLKNGAFAVARPTTAVRRILSESGLDEYLGLGEKYFGA